MTWSQDDRCAEIRGYGVFLRIAKILSMRPSGGIPAFSDDKNKPRKVTRFWYIYHPFKNNLLTQVCLYAFSLGLQCPTGKDCGFRKVCSKDFYDWNVLSKLSKPA